jgi:hypothetical protein
MIKKLVLVLVAALAATTLTGTPALASVPDWDRIAMPTTAQRAQIEAAGLPVQGDGWQFAPATNHVVNSMMESPAVAARRSLSDCASLGGFFFCTWLDINGGGTRWSFNYTKFDTWINNAVSYQGSALNNEASSWVNLTPYTITIFDSQFCYFTAWNRNLVSGAQATAQGSDWNDKVSGMGKVNMPHEPCLPQP